jgi:cytochrome oxidase Cu insertion factor (SCO1/SenC/PrrC family)
MADLIRLMAFAVLVVLLAAPIAWTQTNLKLASADQSGLEVGEKAPKFTLKDQRGENRSLDEYLKKGKVALVFYRSADW